MVNETNTEKINRLEVEIERLHDELAKAQTKVAELQGIVDDEGAAPLIIRRVLGRNWRTTATGTAAAGGFIAMHWPPTAADIATALSFLGLGLVSKDHNVTGGTEK